MPIFGLLRLQRFGGRPVAVVGGGTGMIGDPSGRSSERNLLDREALEANVASIRSQLERFLDFGAGEGGALMVNNLDWLGEFSLIEFLRDVGKHFTVPYMLAKDSVQVRLDRGLSFTEFSYMLLQAADFEHLHRTMGVELQMGGADQWGNITAGLELIRRRGGVEEGSADPAHGLAYKLLLSPSGAKFGKSEGGESVWLDAALTTPFAFYQYWLNTDDRDVGTYLRWFTEFPREEIERLDASVASRAGGVARRSGHWLATSRRGRTGRRRRRPRSSRRRRSSSAGWCSWDRTSSPRRRPICRASRWPSMGPGPPPGPPSRAAPRHRTARPGGWCPRAASTSTTSASPTRTRRSRSRSTAATGSSEPARRTPGSSSAPDPGRPPVLRALQ